MLCAAGFTVSVSTADVPARNAASPLYAAVIACVPTASEEVVYPTAPPLRPAVPPGSAVSLSEKVTVPVGRPKKGPAGVTGPVNVTACPALDGFGEAPSATLVAAGPPSSTSAVLPPPPVTTTSVRLSPLKSAKATDAGPLPALKFTAAWKVPSPLPSSTLTLFAALFATTKSGRPSPFRSPSATACGLAPTAQLTVGWKVPSPLPSRTPTAP